jgi:Na+/H+ antiporter NhaC
MKRFILFLLLLFLSTVLWSNETALVTLEKPLIVMQDIDHELILNMNHYSEDQIQLKVNGESSVFSVQNHQVFIPINISKETLFTIETEDRQWQINVDPIPLWFSVIPPLVAILFALLFKEVFTALFMGIFIGTSTIWYFYGESFFMSIGKGFFFIITDYVIQALNDTGHLSIIVFSMMIGGMVHIITRNGGMAGIVSYLSRFAKTRKSGQFITWLLGISIFFDDYANTLVVGNTMRPVADQLRISREKLAYLVDSTAAPIASIALITTWVGAELSYIQDGIKLLELNETPYMVFLSSLKYAFYPIFTLGFILILIYSGRDFGPMRRAELKIQSNPLASSSENKKDQEFAPKKGIKTKAYNALIPVLVVVFGTMAGLVITGLQSASYQSDLSFWRNLSQIIGNADSYVALLWSSLAGTMAAIVLSVSQRLLSLQESVESLIDGFKLMITAMLILTLAWSLAALTEDIRTAEFISGTLIHLNVNVFLLPAFTFILSALVAFSTGSSWGTMAILYPLMLPATWLLGEQAGLNYEEILSVFHNVVAVILAGSVMGDHCSPISDTTIMSSLASHCHHIDHVRTQLPYALSVGAVALLIGTLPAAFGLPVIVSYVLGFALLATIVYFFGKKSNSILENNS